MTTLSPARSQTAERSLQGCSAPESRRKESMGHGAGWERGRSGEWGRNVLGPSASRCCVLMRVRVREPLLP